MNDDFCCLHLDPVDMETNKQAQSCLCSNAINPELLHNTGDIILHVVHLVELVAKVMIICGGCDECKGGCGVGVVFSDG